MALTKLDGKYYTPGGCSAWNGRCFSAAGHDFKCEIGYISFSRSGWYKRPNTPFWIMREWFERNEDPGCSWNSPQGAQFRKEWRAVTDDEGDTAIMDYLLNKDTLIFEPTLERIPEDWFIPCTSKERA